MNLNRDIQFRGWGAIAVGILCLVGGIWSALREDSRYIYVGAIVAGPLLIGQGIRDLRRYADFGPPSDYEKGIPDAPHPAGLLAIASNKDTLAVQVTCEACAKPYVYYPAMTPLSTAHFLMKGVAVAPCPQCGWIQQPMFSPAREQRPMVWGWIGILLLFGSALFFLYAMMKIASPEKNQEVGPGDQLKYWIANGLLVLAGLVCLLRERKLGQRWDPNGQPLKQRLALAYKLSLPLEVHENLIANSNVAPSTHEFSPAAIKPIPASNGTSPSRNPL